MSAQIRHRSLTLRLAAGEQAPDTREIPVIASSDALDDYGEIVDQETWQLARFLRAPVALWQHSVYDDPIGFYRDVRVEGGALRATLVLYAGAADPEGRAEAVLQRYRQGGPVSVSVGFNVGETDSVQRDGREIRVLKGCELYEISVVSIGANPEAVALRAARRRARRTKETSMTFQEYLAARGMSPEECASAAGMTVEEVQMFLSGTQPTAEQAAKLAVGLGLTAEEVQAMFAPAPEAAPSVEIEIEPAETESKSLVTFGRTILSVLGMKSTEAAIARVRTLLDGEKATKDLTQRVAVLEAERSAERRAKVLDVARSDGRLPKAREEKLAGYLARLSDPDALAEYLGTLEPAVDLRERAFPAPSATPSTPRAGSTYTAEQLAAARDANEARRASRLPR